jgi:hypothetical protein
MNKIPSFPKQFAGRYPLGRGIIFSDQEIYSTFENRPTITTVFDVSQTVARFLSNRRFARFLLLAKSTAQGVQLAASALEARTAFVVDRRPHP